MEPSQKEETGSEQRSEERVPAALPVELENATGLTRDVSPSGLYFETDGDFSAGTVISFAVNFDTPAGKMVLNCQGEIVRVVRGKAKLGVAVKIFDSTLRPQAADAENPALVHPQ